MPASHFDIYRAPSVCPALGWVRLWGDRDYSREWRLRLPSWAVHRARGTVGGHTGQWGRRVREGFLEVVTLA